MDSNYNGGSTFGCMGWILLLFAGVAMFLALPGDYSSTRSETHLRSGVLSGNQTELLSRNQANIASTVWNCYGDGSCSTVITTTATSNETTQTTSTNMDVAGDRNAIQLTNSGVECWDDAAQRYSVEACRARGVLP